MPLSVQPTGPHSWKSRVSLPSGTISSRDSVKNNNPFWGLTLPGLLHMLRYLIPPKSYEAEVILPASHKQMSK